MSDFLERLQTALGPDYRIERELGGGMSRVFVAADTRLGRKVVVKVLPPELAGGVNLERFQREIRVSAGLQHPHIVPLLSAGVAGDLPYYLMPYIEGESLRTRIDREGELPLAEGLRYLREVLDALQFAHAHGVVHRDIKPDNVLLSAGHAVVTDFGVAHALSEATGDSRLTSTGIALGTPAYMAPEQITGEHVDQRADIYATGSLAFEMLTGIPPFRGGSAQALLAAHMAQVPPTPSSVRPAIGSEIDALVLKCLEKRPADRWQSASEVVSRLDAVAEVPTRTGITAGIPSPARTTHPLRVALLFGLASVVVLALIWKIVQVAGLPDWVFQGAIALLAVGLPIMLYTALRERQRVVAGMTATPQGLERLFTWRRSIQGGVMAFAALGVAAALFMTSRALGIGPGATLLSAGVLTTRDRIVIADFENRTTDSTLGITVPQLLRIDLAQSPAISVMEPGQVADVLARMQRDRNTVMTPEVAREVTAREGMKAYVAGEILPAGTGYVITARLVSSSTGDALVSLRQAVATPDKLMQGVDRLSSKLREEVGESLQTVRADPPLEEVTTSSLTALRLYAEATNAADRSGYDQAIKLLEQAVAEDSNFAMAYRRLGMYALNFGGNMRAKADSAMRRAYALRERLTERERKFVEASVAMGLDFDLEKGAAIYTSLVEKYPNDITALNNLGAVLSRLGRGAESLEWYRRTIATGLAPTLTYGNAIGTASQIGDTSTAKAMLKQLARDRPGTSDIPEFAITLAAESQDFSGVDSLARLMLDGPPQSRSEAQRNLAMLAAMHGKMGEAERQAAGAVRVDRERGVWGDEEAALVTTLDEIGLAVDVTPDPRHLARQLEVQWERSKQITARRPPFLRRHVQFGPLFARLGDTTRARALANEFATLTQGQRWPAAGTHVRVAIALSNIAAVQGKPEEARALLREGCGYTRNLFALCDSLAFLELAIAHDRAGQADSAIAVYKRFAGLRAMRMVSPGGEIDFYTVRLPMVWRRLGELYEERGDRLNAIEWYERFLQWWKDADSDLQPTVRSVRERADRLRRATG